jgi:hypothetical protein
MQVPLFHHQFFVWNFPSSYTTTGFQARAYSSVLVNLAKIA